MTMMTMLMVETRPNARKLLPEMEPMAAEKPLARMLLQAQAKVWMRASRATSRPSQRWMRLKVSKLTFSR